jgi:hypothetical protein
LPDLSYEKAWHLILLFQTARLYAARKNRLEALSGDKDLLIELANRTTGGAETALAIEDIYQQIELMLSTGQTTALPVENQTPAPTA